MRPRMARAPRTRRAGSRRVEAVPATAHGAVVGEIGRAHTQVPQLSDRHAGDCRSMCAIAEGGWKRRCQIVRAKSQLLHIRRAGLAASGWCTCRWLL